MPSKPSWAKEVDGLPLRLCIDAAEIHAFVQRSSDIPLQVQRWGAQWLH